MRYIASTIALALFMIVFGPGQLYAESGLITIKSPYSVGATANRLEHLLRKKGQIVFARISHSDGAMKAGLSLKPTELIIFGNPKGGTPLMNCNRTIAIDLPQKFLIWQADDGQVWLTYNDMDYLVKRHGIEECAPNIAFIKKALDGFAREATKP